jgi:hypothetical protein
MRVPTLLVVATVVLAGCATASGSSLSRSAGSGPTDQTLGIQIQPAPAAGAAETVPVSGSLHSLPARAPTGTTVVAPARPGLIEKPVSNAVSGYCPGAGREELCAAP